MPKEREEIVKTVPVRLNQEEAKIFGLIAKYLGLRNDAEVIRYLIFNFYRGHRSELILMLEDEKEKRLP